MPCARARETALSYSASSTHLAASSQAKQPICFWFRETSWRTSIASAALPTFAWSSRADKSFTASSPSLSEKVTCRITSLSRGRLSGGSPREGVRSELASGATTGGGGRSAPDPDYADRRLFHSCSKL